LSADDVTTASGRFESATVGACTLIVDNQGIYHLAPATGSQQVIITGVTLIVDGFTAGRDEEVSE